MTQSPSHPSKPEDIQDEYIAAADELAVLDEVDSIDENEDDEEDEEGEGKSGKGGGKRPKKGLEDYDVRIDRALIDLDMDRDIEPLEALAELINKLKKAAPSEIIKGVSAMGPEHPDITLRELGLQTTRLNAKNIADPDLLKKLDQLQRDQRQREGIPHPDDALLASEGGNAGGLAGAVLGGIVAMSLGDTEKPQDKAKARRDDAKFDNRQERDRKREAPVADDRSALMAEATAMMAAYKTDEVMQPKAGPDLSDIVDMFDDLQFDNPDDIFEKSYADTLDIPDKGQQANGPTEFDNLREFFNYVATLADTPVQQVRLEQELHLEQLAPALQRFDL